MIEIKMTTDFLLKNHSQQTLTYFFNPKKILARVEQIRKVVSLWVPSQLCLAGNGNEFSEKWSGTRWKWKSEKGSCETRSNFFAAPSINFTQERSRSKQLRRSRRLSHLIQMKGKPACKQYDAAIFNRSGNRVFCFQVWNMRPSMFRGTLLFLLSDCFDAILSRSMPYP